MTDNPAHDTRDKLGVRWRADLAATAMHHQGRRYWLIRDPLARRVVRLSDSDYQQLRQVETADQGLVAEAAGQQLLFGMPGARPRKSRLALNPLCIRFPGVDADRFLTWLVPRTQWLFAWQSVCVWMALVMLASLLVLTQIQQFTLALPSFHAFFGPQNWIPLAVTIVATKIVHELAHGAVCRRFGARCPEIGLLLLCGAPCLYCDVTDSWALPSRWQRAAVMLAGVYVEAILASVATLIWWFASVGAVYYGCMNVMFVCGVSTLLFNLNPLMRFDGYYVLSDLVNIPNLRSQSASAWQSIVVARLGGEAYRSAMPRRPRGARWLAAFHAASTLWRLIAVAAIACWLLAVADSAHVLPLGYAAASALVIAAVIPMFRKMTSVMRGVDAWKGVDPMRRGGILVGLTVGTIALFTVPLPQRISADGIVDFGNATTIYVRTGGQVQSVAVEFGQAVCSGQPLLQLESPRLMNDQIRLVSQSAEARLRVASLRRRALSNPQLLEQWDSRLATADGLTQRAEFIERQVRQLKLRSSSDGVILPLLDASPAPSIRLQNLTGQHLAEGRKVCRIGDPTDREVVLEIDADQRALIEIGSRLRIRFTQNGIGVVASEVAAISEIRQQDDDKAIGHVEKFRIICKLPDQAQPLVGTRVSAKVTAPPKPLYLRIAHLLRTTF